MRMDITQAASLGTILLLRAPQSERPDDTRLEILGSGGAPNSLQAPSELSAPAPLCPLSAPLCPSCSPAMFHSQLHSFSEWHLLPPKKVMQIPDLILPKTKIHIPTYTTTYKIQGSIQCTCSSMTNAAAYSKVYVWYCANYVAEADTICNTTSFSSRCIGSSHAMPTHTRSHALRLLGNVLVEKYGNWRT